MKNKKLELISLMNKYLVIENLKEKIINEITYSKCSHKHQGESALINTDDGIKCSIYGRKFNMK